MIISNKMKPVISVLLVILVALAGIRIYQANCQPKQATKTAEQELLENWALYMINLQKHVSSGAVFEEVALSSDVTFDINKSGKVSNVKLAKTSNNNDFDSRVIKIIKKSSPCAPLPQKYEGQGITVNFTLGKDIVGSYILKEW